MCSSLRWVQLRSRDPSLVFLRHRQNPPDPSLGLTRPRRKLQPARRRLLLRRLQHIAAFARILRHQRGQRFRAAQHLCSTLSQVGSGSGGGGRAHRSRPSSWKHWERSGGPGLRCLLPLHAQHRGGAQDRGQDRGRRRGRSWRDTLAGSMVSSLCGEMNNRKHEFCAKKNTPAGV